VVITGASLGIGAALAQHFLRMGRWVEGIDVNPPSEELARSSGYTHQLADITDEAALDAALTLAWSRAPVGAVLANAAVTDLEHRRAAELPYAVWQRVLRVNVDGAFLTGRLAARRMIPQRFGNIVFITSSLAKLDQALANDAPYCTSKAAVEMIAKVLSMELAEARINVNTLFPSDKIDTGFFAHLPDAERRKLARPSILNSGATFLAELPPQSLTGVSVDQARFDADVDYRRSLGAVHSRAVR
jgi:NAD(P)-dependent dehydrogenase (short-subunit alcohol dehydrogenase family)